MYTRFLLRASASLALAALGLGCSSVDVPAHDLEVVVDDQGVTRSGVIAFEDRDEDVTNSKATASCGLYTGDCGHEFPTKGALRGGAPTLGPSFTLVSGSYTSFGEGVNRTYDLVLQRAPSGTPPQETAYGNPVDPDRVSCRLYYFGDNPRLSEISDEGKTSDCSPTVKLTVRFRDPS